MYRILTDVSHIWGLAAESCRVLRRSVIRLRPTSDLTPHAYSIQWPNSTSCHLLMSGEPTPGMPLNHVYPLPISLEWFTLLHLKHIFFLLAFFESLPPSNQRESILLTLNISMQPGLIPLDPSECLNLCFVGMWRPLLKCHNSHAACQPIHLRMVSTTHILQIPNPRRSATTLNWIWLRRIFGPYTYPRFWYSFCRLCSNIELQLARSDIKRQLLLGDSADDLQLPLTCIPHFLEQA
jgi:hypothetical protein